MARPKRRVRLEERALEEQGSTKEPSAERLPAPAVWGRCLQSAGLLCNGWARSYCLPASDSTGQRWLPAPPRCPASPRPPIPPMHHPHPALTTHKMRLTLPACSLASARTSGATPSWPRRPGRSCLAHRLRSKQAAVARHPRRRGTGPGPGHPRRGHSACSMARRLTARLR